MEIPNTVFTHPPAFGSGETLKSGVYYIGSAGSLGGTIILDGERDPDAVFIFRFAGAFSVASQSLEFSKMEPSAVRLFGLEEQEFLQVQLV